MIVVLGAGRLMAGVNVFRWPRLSFFILSSRRLTRTRHSKNMRRTVLTAIHASTLTHQVVHHLTSGIVASIVSRRVTTSLLHLRLRPAPRLWPDRGWRRRG